MVAAAARKICIGVPANEEKAVWVELSEIPCEKLRKARSKFEERELCEGR